MALLDAFTRMKEVQEGHEEAGASDEEESEDDDEEDSEDEQLLEETEDEFFDRYAKAAADLENEMVEGDIEDDVQELELGVFEEINLEASLLQLVQSHRRELMSGQNIITNCSTWANQLFYRTGSLAPASLKYKKI